MSAGRERPLRVLVAGAGVAGLEALLALRDLAGDRVELSLLSPQADFVYRPIGTLGRGHAARHPLAGIAADVGAELVRGALAGVDDHGRAAFTAAGERLEFDALLVAVGAHSERALRPALTWTPESDPELFGGLLRDLEEGYVKRVGFVVTPGVDWALPAYELALMTAGQAWDMGQADVELTVYTHEDTPLELFGTRAATAVRHDLDAAGVAVETGVYVAEAADGPQRLVLYPGERTLDVQRVVALPRSTGPALPGLPADPRGFVRCDLHGRVPGVDGVWAAGDAIAFPIKQGGLAAQQADAAAEAIAAFAGVDIEPAPFRPELREMLLTGRGAEWMRGHIVGGAGEATASHRALWWPPTKVVGRYLSPYLAALEGTRFVEDAALRDGDSPPVAGAPRGADRENRRARFARHRIDPPVGAYAELG